MSRTVRIARSTVKEYLDRAAAVGLNWEAVAELSEEEAVDHGNVVGFGSWSRRSFRREI